jgi:hypothetical protein
MTLEAILHLLKHYFLFTYKYVRFDTKGIWNRELRLSGVHYVREK